MNENILRNNKIKKLEIVTDLWHYKFWITVW